MKKIIIFIFIFMCIFHFSYAQYKLKGTLVSDLKKEPIEDGVVSITTTELKSIKATTTGKDGRFEIPLVNNEYIIHFQALGYYPYSMKITLDTSKDLDLRNIPLVEDSLSTTLSEVHVVAENKIQTISGSTYFPSSQQIKAARNTLSLFEQMHIPRLIVNEVEGTLSIRGTNNIVYKINGIPATLNEIKAINPDNILRVEYNDMPTIRYADSNSGLINITLKERNVGLLFYSEGRTAFDTGLINGNASLSKYYKRNQFSINYSSQWRNYTKWRADLEENFKLNSGEEYRNQEGINSPFRYLSQNIDLKYQYSGEKDLLSIKFNNSINSQKNTDASLVNQSFENKKFNRLSRNKFDSYVPSIDLSYIRKIDQKKELEFNVVGTYISSDGNRKLLDFNDANIIDEVLNKVDGDRYSIIAEGIFSNKINNLNYSIGLRSMYAHSKNKYKIENEISKLQNVEQYPYGQIRGQYDKFSFSVGTGLKFMYADNKDQNYHYYKVLFATRSKYDLSEFFSLYLYTQLRPNFPSLSDFSNIEQPVDNIFIMRGNSYIKPYYDFNNSINLTFNKGIFNADLLVKNYRGIKPIRPGIYSDKESNKLYIQNINQKYDNNFGIELNYSVQSLFNFLSVGINTSWDNYHSKGEFYSHYKNEFNIGTSADATYKNYTLYGGYSKAVSYLSGEILERIAPKAFLGLSYGKGNFNVYGTVSNLFLKDPQYKTNRMSSVASLKKSVYIKDNDSMFVLGFSYSFSSGKKNENVNKRINNSDQDNSIMRVKE